MGITYQEHPIARPLADAVQTFWSIQGRRSERPEPPFRYRVLPDGCVDLIARHTPSIALGQPGPCELLVTGLVARFLMVTMIPDTTLWGMQFRPGWVEPVLGINPLELPVRLEPAALLTSRLASLSGRLQRVQTPDAVGTTFRDGVSSLVADSAPGGLPSTTTGLVCEALDLLRRSHGRIGIDELARTLGVSGRSLNRHLTRAIGMPPKTFARIVRFRHVHDLLVDPPNATKPSLSKLALLGGYSDQSHLSNEFRALSGLTPASFLG